MTIQVPDKPKRLKLSCYVNKMSEHSNIAGPIETEAEVVFAFDALPIPQRKYWDLFFDYKRSPAQATLYWFQVQMCNIYVKIQVTLKPERLPAKFTCVIHRSIHCSRLHDM